MRKVVLDTNILVSSIFGGKPREVLNLFRDGRLILVVSEQIVAEYLEVLARFGEVKAEIEDLLALLLEQENVVFVSPAELVAVIAEDPDDDMFLACALAGEVDAIVSGDRHLLDLARYQGVEILDPGAFLDAWNRSKTEE